MEPDNPTGKAASHPFVLSVGSKASYFSAARTVIGVPVGRGSCKKTDSDSGSPVWGGVCVSNKLLVP